MLPAQLLSCPPAVSCSIVSTTIRVQVSPIVQHAAVWKEWVRRGQAGREEEKAAAAGDRQPFNLNTSSGRPHVGGLATHTIYQILCIWYIHIRIFIYLA